MLSHGPVLAALPPRASSAAPLPRPDLCKTVVSGNLDMVRAWNPAVQRQCGNGCFTLFPGGRQAYALRGRFLEAFGLRDSPSRPRAVSGLGGLGPAALGNAQEGGGLVNSGIHGLVEVASP